MLESSDWDGCCPRCDSSSVNLQYTNEDDSCVYHCFNCNHDFLVIDD